MNEKLLKAQAKDLRRQLHEAWKERDEACQAMVALARAVVTMAVELERRSTP